MKNVLTMKSFTIFYLVKGQTTRDVRTRIWTAQVNPNLQRKK